MNKMQELENLKKTYQEQAEKLAFNARARDYWDNNLRILTDRMVETKSRIRELETAPQEDD